MALPLQYSQDAVCFPSPLPFFVLSLGFNSSEPSLQPPSRSEVQSLPRWFAIPFADALSGPPEHAVCLPASVQAVQFLEYSHCFSSFLPSQFGYLIHLGPLKEVKLQQSSLCVIHRFELLQHSCVIGWGEWN